MWKDIFAPLVHRAILMIIALLAAKHYIGADVAQKMNAGDTVHLWANYDLSTTIIENYIWAVLIPAAASSIIASWGRIKSRFKVIKARLFPQKLSNGDIKEIVKEASPLDILKTVYQKP